MDSRMESLKVYIDGVLQDIHCDDTNEMNENIQIVIMVQKCWPACHDRDFTASAVTRIRTWVVSATTRSTNHYTITANWPAASRKVYIQTYPSYIIQCNWQL